MTAQVVNGKAALGFSQKYDSESEPEFDTVHTILSVRGQMASNAGLKCYDIVYAGVRVWGHWRDEKGSI